MIKDTDIKAYNHLSVKGDNGIYTVYGFNLAVKHPQTETEVLLDRPHSAYEKVRISRLRGIPLTEERLKLLGFVFDGLSYAHPINTDWTLCNITKNTKPAWEHVTHEPCANNRGTDTFKILSFVHELQNFFYEHNGVMLMFEDSWKLRLKPNTPSKN
jgi:hypothetical protein